MAIYSLAGGKYPPDPPAIVQSEEDRARKECMALDKDVTGANRKLAQWLFDNPKWSGADVAHWLDCSKTRINDLRKWAKGGFMGAPHNPVSRQERDQHGGRDTLKTKHNFQDDAKPKLTEEQLAELGDEWAARDGHPVEEDGGKSSVGGVEEPAEVLTNILDSIKHAKSVAEAYRKILKASSFDREAKAEIHNAISQLIVKWRIVQSSLDKKGQGNGSTEIS